MALKFSYIGSKWICLLFYLILFTAMVPPRHPHLTGCVSTNLETFRCRWNVDYFQNLSQPGDLRLFYINNKPPHAPPKEWSECPHYSTDRPNECFFNENHTTVWAYYSVQLRSKDLAILYDENRFNVEDIVQPDPPVGLNWTLLNMSLTGAYYDIMLSWKPPRSADVEMGWMTLQYEIQYRSVTSELWEVVDLVKNTQRSIYGLQTNVNHEVRVRCKMHGGKEFGEFSNSVFVHISSKVSTFPVVALFIFGSLCLVAILMLVVISQQEKLMVILLPPVPGPKIRGIDPEILKKGKLRELTSILGAPPELRPELYNNDIEEQNDTLTDLDTDWLMDHSLSSNCSPLSVGFRDDDSGRASCCDPDLPSELEVSPFHPLTPTQILSKEPSCPAASEQSTLVQGSTGVEPLFVAPSREALYTQVSGVRSSGNVLLSPEVDKTTNEDSEKDMTEKEKEKKAFQLLVMNADDGGYTSELNAGNMSPRSSEGDMSERDMSDHSKAGEDLSSSPSPSPYYKSDTSSMSALAPVPVYTMVEGVDTQNSLLLTPNSTLAPQMINQKSVPTPDGYLAPDLLSSVTL
uniref:Fibronectin type-III domain-containing protein n=1 Tax=Monopterus albus TaxID=43700 RepID=A0A3Q3J5K9_MONAL